MKLFIIATIIAAATGAQLPSSSYLPSNQGSQGGFQGGSAGGYQGGSGGGFQGGFQAHSGGGFGGGSQDTGNRRPQQEAEKNAAIVKQDQDVNENGFHYSYETSNGIRAEEGGDTKNTQGGFAYKGDDGITYSIVFTAGEGGFRPQGAHLPVAPPTPEAILQALEQNAKDEAAGIFDDGKYHPDPNESGKSHGQGGFSSGQGGSSSGSFGSANHQGSFTPNGGYRY